MSSHIEAASVAPPDIVLQGNSGGECEAFVVAIQEYAFATGQDDDPQWMMRFARTRLRGKALRWYAHLDPSMKKDWELFVQAMFDQYPFDEQPMESDVRTSVWSSTTFSPSGSTAALPVDSEINHRVQNTGSSGPLQEAFLSGNPNDLDKSLLRGPALSTRQYSPSSTGQKVGRLRIVYEEETSTLEYVWWNYIAHGIEWIEDSNYERSNRLQTTLNRHEALIVQFLPSSMCHTIGCLNSKTGNKYLAIRYPRSAKSPYLPLYGCNDNHPVAPRRADSEALTCKVWRVLEDGTLEASLSVKESSRFRSRVDGKLDTHEDIQFKTTEVHIHNLGDIISFVQPGMRFQQHGKTTSQEREDPRASHHASVRARIVFEPL